MSPLCIVLICSWWRLLADCHLSPFPWTLSWRWCPSASQHPATFLFLHALSFPLYFTFLSLRLSLHRWWCPSASYPVSFLFLLVQSFPLYFSFSSLGRLCVWGASGGRGYDPEMNAMTRKPKGP